MKTNKHGNTPKWIVIKQGLNKRIMQHIFLAKRRREFKNKDLSIISVNCIGGVISHDFGWRFLSPTVNLRMSHKDFLNFCENLDECLSCDITEIHGNAPYPVGEMVLQSGIKIILNFVHYKSFEEAVKKWQERCKRVNKEKMIFVFTDTGSCDDEDVQRFDKLPYPKILFAGQEKYSNLYDYAVFVKPTKKELEKKINPVDICMWFVGLSGRRRYEKYVDIEDVMNEIIK